MRLLDTLTFDSCYTCDGYAASVPLNSTRFPFFDIITFSSKRMFFLPDTVFPEGTKFLFLPQDGLHDVVVGRHRGRICSAQRERQRPILDPDIGVHGTATRRLDLVWLPAMRPYTT